jgi:RNA polymerase sigma-70 factor (ECF subfamily)
MTEARLLQRARAGDRRALDRLLRRELPAIRGVVRAILGCDTELDDVTQQVLIELVRALDSFRGESSLRTWLTRIAIRTTWAHIRMRQKVVRLVVAAEQRPPAAQRPTGTESYCELARLERCLAQLPAEQRVVFLMHDVEGHTTREISETLQIPAGTVSTRLRTARERVRRSLHPKAAALQRLGSGAGGQRR